MNRILVVGQTPPPMGGQAVMIKLLLAGCYENAELVHVRMAFSKGMGELGAYSLFKLLHLLRVILAIVFVRLTQGTRVLYYPPSSGPGKLPILRDMAILCSTRWMFSKTIFHFHAAGLGDMYGSLPPYLKPFYRWAYLKPDLAIQLSEHNPDDGEAVHAQKTIFVPNGLEDHGAGIKRRHASRDKRCSILYVGLLTESKGVVILSEAMKNLARRGIELDCVFVGEFATKQFEESFRRKIAEDGLGGQIRFTGELTGSDKHQAYQDADIFCFPTFFESESFGLVVAEAMQYSLPVVASDWRGVKSLVVDGETGFLTPVQDAAAVADKLALLAENPERRQQMGAAGRRRYTEEYSASRFYERMNDAFGLV